jgi:hypothetical protein
MDFRKRVKRTGKEDKMAGEKRTESKKGKSQAVTVMVVAK